MDNTHENPVAGIRSWRAEDRGLLALHRDVLWRREMRSECGFWGHTEPNFDCQCGLWARYSLEVWETHEGVQFVKNRRFHLGSRVVGVVSSAGCEIIRGETGFRAGEMRIEAFIAYRCEVEALGTTVSLLPALQALADRIGVPVISPREIEMFCALEGYELLPPLVGEESEADLASGGLVNMAPHVNAFALAKASVSAARRIFAQAQDTKATPTGIGGSDAS